jgi:predicted dehydrogenase
LISSYKDLHDIEVYAVCENNKKRLNNIAKEYHIPKNYTNYKKMLKNKDIDIVVIATPPFLHSKLAIDCLNSGKNVLCEKPLALNLNEGKKIKKAMEKSQKLVAVNYMFRASKMLDLVKCIIKKNILGKIQNIVFENYARDDNLPKNHWFWDKKKSGGIWIEHGVHFFDLFRYLISQEPVKITSLSVKRNKNIEDQVSALVLYDEGCNAFFSHSFTKPLEIETEKFSLSFEKGNIQVHGWIPEAIEISAVVNESEYNMLKNMFKHATFVEEKLNKNIEGRGKSYKISKKILITYTLKESKGKIYKDLVKTMMINLVRSIKRKENLRAGIDEGLSSLKDALTTEKNNVFNFKLK